MAIRESRTFMPWRAAAILLVTFALYLVMNYLMVTNVFDNFEERGARISLIYGAWVVCGFLVFVFVITASSVRLLFLLVPLFLVSVATNYAYIILGKRPLSFEVMEWLPRELAQLPNAWREFPIDIPLAIIKAVVILGLFLVLRHGLRRYGGRWISSTKTSVFALFAFLAFHGTATALQPPQMMAETNVFVFGLPAVLSASPDPNPVGAVPERRPLAEKLVLIVDESVTYAAYRDVVEPILKHAPVVDFGEAASTTNCSAPSNALLRWGIERPHIRNSSYDPRTNPTIWAYARAAGMRTVLIDGQSSGAIHNYLRPQEFSLIDEFIPAYVGLDTDLRIAKRLKERLQRPGAEFIYVVTHGAHFPYDMNYPKGLVADDASRSEKYRAAIGHSTGRFFSELLTGLPIPRLFMVYTSDHGQAARAGSTHCNPDPDDNEYSVPMVALTGVPALRGFLGDVRSMHNRASHLNIFPTLLYALGYRKEWLESMYGPTLAGPPAPYITYVSLGWNTKVSRDKRLTVDAQRFVESEGFPRRAPAK